MAGCSPNSHVCHCRGVGCIYCTWAEGRKFLKSQNLKKEAWAGAAGSWWGIGGSRKTLWTGRKWQKHGQILCSPFSALLSTSEMCGYFSPLFPHQWCWLKMRWPVLKEGFVPEEIWPSVGQVVGRNFLREKTAVSWLRARSSDLLWFFSWDGLEAK